MGTYTIRKRMAVSDRKNKARSPNSTKLFQEGTPSPPSKVTTTCRTSPRSSVTKKTESRRGSSSGLEMKANFNYYANTILASPSKNKLHKPCAGFTTKETNRMTQHTKYSKDRLRKMIAELEKRQNKSTSSDVIGTGTSTSELTKIQPRKLTYHRAASQFFSGDLINTQDTSLPVQIEQVWKPQEYEGVAGACIVSDDCSARMTNFPGYKIKQLLKANSLDQAIACHIQGDARAQFQQMIRYQDILKNVGTEIMELDAAGLPDSVIENEVKPSKLLPLAGLMMAHDNLQHEEQQTSHHADQTEPTPTSSPSSSQTSTTGIEALAAAVQEFQNGIEIENNTFATEDLRQNPMRMIILTKEGRFRVITSAGEKEQGGFDIQKVCVGIGGEGTQDNPIIIDDH